MIRARLLIVSAVFLVAVISVLAVTKVWQSNAWMDSVTGKMIKQVTLFGFIVSSKEVTNEFDEWVSKHEGPVARDWVRVEGTSYNAFGFPLVFDHSDAPPIYYIRDTLLSVLVRNGDDELISVVYRKLATKDRTVQDRCVRDVETWTLDFLETGTPPPFPQDG